MGRFTQADTIIPGAGNSSAWDRYSYTLNNPLRYSDPSGHWFETALDVAFIAYDIYDISANGLNWENGLSLAADVVGAVLPVVTGGGMAVRAIMHADDAVDAIKIADKVIDAGNATDNLADLGKVIGDICSFSADTQVATDEGDVEIASLEIGDLVLAWDEETGGVGYYEVVDTFSHVDSILTELIINGEWIETTPEHPFYTEEEGWLPAKDLKTGMHIRQADGDYELVWLKWNIEKDQEMYNLTVDTAHTFFVGEGQWLVHNSCKEYIDRFTEAVGRPPLPNHDLHHGFPQTFVEWFDAKGVDIHAPENMFELPKELHTLKPDGIHTGPFKDSWNGIWLQYKGNFPFASRNDIFKQLEKMGSDFNITKYRVRIE